MSRGQLRLIGKKKSTLRTSLWHAGDVTASPRPKSAPNRVTFTSAWPQPERSLRRRGWSAVRKGGSEEQRGEPRRAGGDARLSGRAGWSSAASGGRLRGCHDEVQPPFKARITAELISSSYAAADSPLVVGTLEVGFLLLFQSLSHPSISILLADLSPTRPCVASCSGAETQKDKG